MHKKYLLLPFWCSISLVLVATKPKEQKKAKKEPKTEHVYDLAKFFRRLPPAISLGIIAPMAEDFWVKETTTTWSSFVDGTTWIPLPPEKEISKVVCTSTICWYRVSGDKEIISQSLIRPTIHVRKVLTMLYNKAHTT